MRSEFFSRERVEIALLCCAILLAPHTSFAEDSNLSEEAYLQDFPVVLSASRLSQPLSEAPNAMTVIDHDTIHSSGYRNIADLFRLVPGMYVGYQDGHSPFVSYHGSTDNYARRMQVLIDGRSVYLPPFGQVDWEDIPVHIDDIERIEVIRGPAAASYGSNSTQGVINIITSDASALKGGRLSVNKGEAGISDTTARFGGGGDDLDYRVTMGERADTGYADKKLNDNSATRLANFRANYHPNATDSIDMQMGYSEGVRGLGVVGRLNTDPFRDIQTRSDFEQLEWTRALQQGDEVKLRYYHISRKYSDTTNPLIPIDVISTQRDDVEFQHTMAWGSGNRVVWGGGVKTDTLDNPLSFARFSRPAPTNKQSRLFAHDEWRITQAAILNIGTMLENDGIGHKTNSPRMSLNYHLTPLDTVRIGASRAYRTPAAFEEYSNTLYGNGKDYTSMGGVRPEKMLSKEIGYLGEFPSISMTLDSRIYQDRLSDLIFLDPLDPISIFPVSFKNLYSLSVKGFEGSMKFRWGDRSSVVMNYAHQRMSCNASGTLTWPNLLIPWPPFTTPMLQAYIDECPKMVPLDSGSIMLIEQVTPDVSFTISYFNQGTLALLDSYPDGKPQTQMNRVDIRIAKTFGILEKKAGGGEVAVVVQNAFQDNYTEFANVSQKRNLIFDRRAYVTATFNFW